MKQLAIGQKAALLGGNGSWKTYAAEPDFQELWLSDGPYGIRKVGEDGNTEQATCYPPQPLVPVHGIRAYSTAWANISAAKRLSTVWTSS